MDLSFPGFWVCGFSGAFSSSGKTLPLRLFFPPFFPYSVHLSFSVHFLPSLQTVVFPLSSLSALVPLVSFSFLIFHSRLFSFSLLPSLSLALVLFRSPSPPFFRWPPLPPPIVFRLYSPRMHLFKACFTKTVLKLRQKREG